MAMEESQIRDAMEKFRADWHRRLGESGDVLARDLNLLVDAILKETELIIDERVRARVAPWALIDNDDVIPVSKFSKEGILKLLGNREFISDGELFEILRTRFQETESHNP